MNVRRLSQLEQEAMRRAQVVDVAQEHAIARRQAAGLPERRQTFVAPETPQRAPLHVPMPETSANADLSSAIAVVSGTSHDASSARDRAEGFLLRFAALAAIVVVFAVLGLLLFMWTASHFGMQPTWFDKTLCFLLVLSAGLLFGFLKLNGIDYLHSAMGAEHHRLDTLEAMHKRQVKAELKMRREALNASLRLLEMRDDGDN